MPKQCSTFFDDTEFYFWSSFCSALQFYKPKTPWNSRDSRVSDSQAKPCRTFRQQTACQSDKGMRIDPLNVHHSANQFGTQKETSLSRIVHNYIHENEQQLLLFGQNAFDHVWRAHLVTSHYTDIYNMFAHATCLQMRWQLVFRLCLCSSSGRMRHRSSLMRSQCEQRRAPGAAGRGRDRPCQCHISHRLDDPIRLE